LDFLFVRTTTALQTSPFFTAELWNCTFNGDYYQIAKLCIALAVATKYADTPDFLAPSYHDNQIGFLLVPFFYQSLLDLLFYLFDNFNQCPALAALSGRDSITAQYRPPCIR
jgi:hypothetical protein